MKCKVLGCYGLTRRQGLCAGHYRAWKDVLSPTTRPGFTPERTSDGTPAALVCVCTEPSPAAMTLWKPGYLDREPRPGDIVQCRRCGRGVVEFLMATGGE